MASINLDGPSAQLAVVGAKIAQQSEQALASVVSQAASAAEQIASEGSKAAPGPGKGTKLDTSV